MRSLNRFFVGISLILTSCTSQNENAYMYKPLGDSISTSIQMQLMQQLSKAIADSGFAYAVGYCNENVAQLMQQTTHEKLISVQRLSDKNRNPANRITEPLDKEIFESFRTRRADTVIINHNEITYYKPIAVMMPTCLKCHGKENDLDTFAYQKITRLYPNDLAVNYAINDLRGMWKVKFKP